MRPSHRPPAAMLLLLVATLSGCTRVGQDGGEFSTGDEPRHRITAADVARQVIDPRAIERALEFLASDDRRGRATATPGAARAAAWVAEHFQLAGLEPAGENGYLQFWRYAPADTPAANVVGLLEGGDLTRAGEYVVLLAHFDARGVGAPDQAGDSIYNGADDNASGTAALVEIARAFSALPTRPDRPILFLAVTGHEQGTLGARWFVDRPTVHLDRAAAVINLDMVGRNRPEGLGVVGYELSDLGPVFSDTAAAAPWLRLAPYPVTAPDTLFLSGDHLPFARRGIPAVRLYTGGHRDAGTPDDEVAGVDPEKVARVARLAFLVAHAVANAHEPPGWTARGRAVIR